MEMGELISGEVENEWSGSALSTESTIHQLSPYIGKVKSTLAATLVREYSNLGDTVLDPFAGSGTIPMEAWIHGRNCWANDLSPYARVLTAAKLFPPASLEDALKRMKSAGKLAASLRRTVDLRTVPIWVRSFFHPETLRDAIAWVQALRSRREFFILAALLGILHHQRPGFLSFPSSHTTPYLRRRSFPEAEFPELYKYRALTPRLEAKLTRAYRRVPELDFSLSRRLTATSADRLSILRPVGAVITSPPYMRLLDYGRDNRLRLWFLGSPDWKSLDSKVSPNEQHFLALMRRSLKCWHTMLKPGAPCVLVVGDSQSRTYGCSLPEALTRIACKEINLYIHESTVHDPIPIERRSRRSDQGNASESIVILKRQ